MNPKPGKVLDPETEDKVVNFYRSDQVSRVMPGKKDFVSVRSKSNGKREHVQKRLILCNLKEAYRLFKDMNPGVKIGFSKFAQMRPRDCVLAGASGTHCVCVCTTHENVKLMMQGGKMSDLALGNVTLKTYTDCLAQVACNPQSFQCIQRECATCSNFPGKFRNDLLQAYDAIHVDEVQYSKWTNTDRSSLETICQTVEDFVQSFSDCLESLLVHDFVAKSQGEYLRDLKGKLQPGEVIILGDFSENYSMILQDEIQSHHFQKGQATIHPFVAYWKEENDLKHASYAEISDCLSHDTVSVHLFQKKFIDYLEAKIGTRPTKIFYFSDGCAAQYKNCKNFLNLTFHKQDFKMDAEWHFFASSHGKGPCDGIGGTLKRLATRASLQKTAIIQTPRELYDFLRAQNTKVWVSYTSKTEWEDERVSLSERFSLAKTATGTRQAHAVYPLNQGTVLLKRYSASNQGTSAKVWECAK